MGESTRDESTAIAQRLAAVAELFVRRQEPLAQCRWWVADHCDGVAAEVAAVQNISHARAVAQVQFACNLWYRLPRVARVFVSGVIDYRVVSMIVARTENVEDAVMAAVDSAIAGQCRKWMKLSAPKLKDRVDQWVATFDPAGVRVPAKVDEHCYVDVTAAPTQPGMATISGSMRAEDGAALTARLDAIAATVCPEDPRSHQQRRAAATGAVGRGEVTLVCQCGRADCPVGVQRDQAAAAASVVIHVVAEQSTVEGTGNAPGYLAGFGMLPAESVRTLAGRAQLKAVVVPTPTPDPGYRPSAVTREFTRWRDLTCRWPGCDKPVATCELDHTVPYPDGLTHASDLKHYCKIHHLIKTFHPGWAERQKPDGTIVLTSPTGHTYISEAHGAALFPTLGQPTEPLAVPNMETEPARYREVMMPRRKQTREQNRRDRITAERRQRSELIAEEERQRQAWLAQNYEPPPF
ncbi:hypothetical protein A5724_24955 [Mycobacterium sp. ACS1612]|nr:hypothetical protein A5724_24955 [Mycobacterium sp. ACS1612]